MFDNLDIGPNETQTDTEGVLGDTAFFNTSNKVLQISPDINANLIIEAQVPNPNDPSEFLALGWTVLNLFTNSNRLFIGTHKLPLYEPPTDPLVYAKKITEKHQ